MVVYKHNGEGAVVIREICLTCRCFKIESRICLGQKHVSNFRCKLGHSNWEPTFEEVQKRKQVESKSW